MAGTAASRAASKPSVHEALAASRAARKPSVHEALAAVMGEVQGIKKGDRNEAQGGGYSFRGIDRVVNAVGPALRNHGVMVVPIDVEYESERYKTTKGTEMKGVTLKVTFRFYGPAGDYIEAQACGEASDSGDKAVPKAHSVAYRTLLLQALCIPTDEPDPDSESHERGEPIIVPKGAEVAEFPTPSARKRLDSVIGRLIKNGWITPQQIASACEATLEPDATLDDLAPILLGLSAEAVEELTERLTTYGKNKKAEAA